MLILSCTRAASGQAAAAPPMSVMNSHRCTRPSTSQDRTGRRPQFATCWPLARAADVLGMPRLARTAEVLKSVVGKAANYREPDSDSAKTP